MTTSTYAVVGQSLPRSDAREILREDPGLELPEHKELKMNLLLRWAEKLKLYNIG